MSRRRRKPELPAEDENAQVFWHYMNLLKEIACNMYKWEGLPKEIDARFLELTLYEKALAIFFFDDERIRLKASSSSPMFNGDTNRFIAVQGAPAGQINMYHNPTTFLAYGPGGFTRILSNQECVPIWGNFLREPIINSIELYANRLARIDRTIDVNLFAQKTPVVISAPETMRLTMKNFFKQYDANEPVVYIDASTWATHPDNPISAIKTDAPYLIDKLLIDKSKIWSEVMTFLGIDNANQEKRERLVANEVEANNGQIEISRLRGLDARRQACEEINTRYNLNVSVNFNYDILSKNNLFNSDVQAQSEVADEPVEEGDE